MKTIIGAFITGCIAFALLVCVVEYHNRVGGYCDLASDYEQNKIDYIFLCK